MKQMVVSVICIVLYSIAIAACGSGNTGVPLPAKQSKSVQPTQPALSQVPTSGPLQIGQTILENGWLVTLTSCQFNNNYPTVEKRTPAYDNNNQPYYGDNRLVCHLIVKDVSALNPDIQYASYFRLEPMATAGSDTSVAYGEYTPLDSTKRLAPTIPIGSTSEVDIPFSIFSVGYAVNDYVLLNPEEEKLFAFHLASPLWKDPGFPV